MAEHNTLTGANLHEPKGADAASQHTVYVSDGAGSGAWEKVDADSINTSSIKNVNKGRLFVDLGDISATGSKLVPFSLAATITDVTTIIDAAFTTTDAVITPKNAAGSSMGTITIANSGSGKGDVDSVAPASNNTVSADSWIEIEVTTAAGSTVNCTVMIEYTIT